MVDERSDSRAADAAHSPSAPFAVRKAQPHEAQVLAGFLQSSHQLEARFGAPAEADLVALLRKADAGVLVAEAAAETSGGWETRDGSAIGASGYGAIGALGYSLDTGTLRLFSLTVTPHCGQIARVDVSRVLLLCAEEVARERGAVLMAAQVDKRSAAFEAFLLAGFAVDAEEPETTADGGVIAVAEVIKLLEPA